MHFRLATIATHEQISASVISGGQNGGSTSENLTPEYLVKKSIPACSNNVDAVRGIDFFDFLEDISHARTSFKNLSRSESLISLNREFWNRASAVTSFENQSGIL